MTKAEPKPLGGQPRCGQEAFFPSKGQPSLWEGAKVAPGRLNSRHMQRPGYVCVCVCVERAAAELLAASRARISEPA